jgi:predicted dehydrogenase
MVGGGLGGVIGRSHRMAALLDGRWDLVAGALSANPDRAAASAAVFGIAPERSYADWATMAVAEAERQDGIDAVTICTPNHLHHPIARTFLAKGIHVVCDKPLTTTVAEAHDLVDAVRASGLVFALTHTYSGYPMVRLARDMVRAGEIGEVRSIAVEYLSDYQTRLDDPDHWHNDPARSGPFGALGAIGSHAHHLARFITGLEVEAVSADVTTFVPGRRLDDHATVLLRFQGGARGHLWCTTVAVGNENGLRIRIYGSAGGLDWSQEHPNHMRFTRYGEQPVTLSRGGHATSPSAAVSTRIPAGHPEGYIEAFANIYRDTADIVLARETNAPLPDFAPLVPSVVDGARGIHFLEAVLRSGREGGGWADARFTID